MKTKYRIKFVKGDGVKYVPHLDMLRLYQRAVRKANIPIAYSQGFNPHQQMSFAQPLSVGVTSISEYIDIETVDEIIPKDFIHKLNDCLPDGTFITDVRIIKDKEKNSMAAVEAAAYLITLENTIDKLQEVLCKFLSEKELIIEKKSKKSIKLINIRDDIFELRAEDNEKLYAFIAAGSNKNLKAELLVECLYKYMGLEFNPYKIKYERQDLFKLCGEDFVSLFCS